jgi:predicted lipoprotein with Yx(FWY)xxD motif
MTLQRMASVLIAVVFAGIAAEGPANAAREESSAQAVVKVALNKELGKSILVDARGRTLYMFRADSRNKSTCVDDATYHCSKLWPPLRTTGKPRAGRGVKSSLLGLIKRRDGAAQVTYAGHPLYTDAGSPSVSLAPDTKPGDVNGQGFLGVWFAIAPSGKKATG